MGILRVWAFILLFAISSCAVGRIRSSYQIYPVQAPSAATSFAKLGAERARIVMDSYAKSGGAPIRLTASDGTGLEMRALRVRTIIEGPLAFTELLMRFHNPHKREVEGRFEITLPESASIARLAMKLGSKWQEGEVVARRRAQTVYERFLHKQVDPVLLETSVGNQFRARVYPIPASGDKEIIVSYSETLAASGDYELFLSGLPGLATLDVDVNHGERRERFIKRDLVSPSNLRFAGGPTGASALRADELVMMHWIPEQAIQTDVPTKLVVVVDSSASAAGVYGQEVRAVQTLAAELASAYGDTLQLAVACFDNEVHPIFAGAAKDYGPVHSEALLAHGALGASNLEAALLWAKGRGARVLLVSDGVATSGKRSYEELSDSYRSVGVGRIDVLSLSSAKNAELLRSLASERDGVMLSALDSPAKWATELGQRAPSAQKVEVAGASWVWPQEVKAERAGAGVIAFAKFERQGATRLDEIRIDLGQDKNVSELRIPVRDGERGLIQRQWAITQLALLATHQRARYSEARQAQIENISQYFRVLTPDTAFLMLESAADYQRFGIDQNQSSEILAVDATGLRRLRGSSTSPDSAWLDLVYEPFSAKQNARIGEAGSGMSGKVRDKATGESLIGVTVVATHVTAKNAYNAITDEDGSFALRHLPTGTYEVLLIYGDAKARYSAIRVVAGESTTVAAHMDLSQLGDEVVVIKGRALIDTTRTTQGFAIDRSFAENLPIPGRAFESALQVAAGAPQDGLGTSFSGSSSLETSYSVDGVNTSDRSYGTAKERTPATKVRKLGADEREFRRIRNLLRQGVLSRALDASLRWVVKSPTNLLALTVLGEALLASGHYKLAGRAFASILDLYPSRADMHRVAVSYLSRLGAEARELRLDALRFANAARPDHAHGLRLLALELALAEREQEAIALLLAALDSDDDLGRFRAMRELMRHEIGVIAASWLARDPGSAGAIKKLLDTSRIMVPMEKQNYAVLSWESDVALLNLIAEDTDGQALSGRRFEAGRQGYGPTVIVLEDSTSIESAKLSVEFADQAMMGYAFAELQLVSLDAAGHLRVETRPLVALQAKERVAMGTF